ncbi:MAG TPA: MBL fold metallo-hydrolase [Devosiaceae bacterium]|jgi:L-ascorbate metabolism protein UlaG (beta-lactamase superfamily)
MPTRRLVVSGLAALPILTLLPMPIAFAQAKGDTLATSGGDATIHPVNHASLYVGFGDQVLYFDPVGGPALYAGLPKPTAILITHPHGDHFDVPTLTALVADGVSLIAPQAVIDGLPAEMKAKATLMANGQSGAVNGLPVTAVAAYNITPDRLKFHPQGVGNGYVLTLGDKHVYVAGDTEDTPEMRALTGIDVAFLPMNLPYTMTEAQAADAVKAFKPKIVYPYHYMGSDPKKFADLVGDAAEVRLVDWYA